MSIENDYPRKWATSNTLEDQRKRARMSKKRKALKLREDCVKCSRCGIVIGSGYLENIRNTHKGKTVCGWCYNQLKENIEIPTLKLLPVQREGANLIYSPHIQKRKFSKKMFSYIAGKLNLCSKKYEACDNCPELSSCVGGFDLLINRLDKVKKKRVK